MPWMDPTPSNGGRAPGMGSARTIDTYAERLLPLYQWAACQRLALYEIGPDQLRCAFGVTWYSPVPRVPLS